MFRVHVLDVRHGDAIIIESFNGSESLWSIIDCASYSKRIPTIDFIEANNVKRIQSIFLSHLDHDHISGLGDLVDYLIENKIPVEAIYTPILPSAAKVKEKILEFFYPDKIALKKVLKAMCRFPSLKTLNGDKTPISSGSYIATLPSSWHTHVHPGLEVAFISPNEHQISEYFQWILYSPPSKHKNNDLSHVMLVRPSGEDDIFMFPGDLDSSRLRQVKNIAEKVTNNKLREQVRFVKAPHHGVLTKPVEELYDTVLTGNVPVYVCVSCKPGDEAHPNVNFLKHVNGGKYANCVLCCTGMSPHCEELLLNSEGEFKPPSIYNRFELEHFAKLSCKNSKLLSNRPCHGDITITRNINGEINVEPETGKRCAQSTIDQQFHR